MTPGRPFTGVSLNRATEERKDPVRIEQLRADPAARAVIAGKDGVMMRADGDPALVRIKLPPGASYEPILLGLDGATPVFALELETLTPALRSRGRMIGLREAGASLSHSEAGLAAYVTALLNWHRTHSHCANCGAATVVEEGGYSRRCPQCGMTHFPRTDPVVIMTVEHDDLLLLGRRSGWPERRYSVLAGFISPGESAEEAVVREVREESGIVARDPRFVTSQPWPFPSSLMLGFEAQSNGGEPAVGDGELADVRWFTLDDVREAVQDRSEELLLPPPISVARFLIERWVERKINFP